MTAGIYCYVDRKTHKIVYVGKDSNIHKNTRHRQHLSKSRYNAQPFNRVLQNNPNRYVYQVLVWDVATQDRLNALEIQYIRQLQPKFNFTNGGDGVSGLRHSEEAKRRISKAQSVTGFYRVAKMKDKIYHQGFRWRYSSIINGQRIQISSFDLNILQEKVESKGLDWGIVDKAKAQQSLLLNEKFSKETHKHIQNRSSTGFYRVSKIKKSDCKQGFIWEYKYFNNGKRIRIYSIDLRTLEERVKNQNLEWKILNNENALKSLKENEGDLDG